MLMELGSSAQRESLGTLATVLLFMVVIAVKASGGRPNPYGSFIQLRREPFSIETGIGPGE